MTMNIIEMSICRRMQTHTSIILICTWLACRLCTTRHTKCCCAAFLILLYSASHVSTVATCNAISKQTVTAESSCHPVVIPLATITTTVCILELIAIISITIVSLRLKNKLLKQGIASERVRDPPMPMKLEVNENEAYATTLACNIMHNTEVSCKM